MQSAKSCIEKYLMIFSKDNIHTSNPFTNLSNVVSALTTIGHMDVYSLSRESIQRMLPASDMPRSAAGSNGSIATPRTATDTRQFQYRYSMTYIRSLPEGQRPVERETFGMSKQFSISRLSGLLADLHRSISSSQLVSVEDVWGVWPGLPKY